MARGVGVNRHINDNYCVSAPVPRWLNWSKETVRFVNLCQLGPDQTSRTIESL